MWPSACGDWRASCTAHEKNGTISAHQRSYQHNMAQKLTYVQLSKCPILCFWACRNLLWTEAFRSTQVMIILDIGITRLKLTVWLWKLPDQYQQRKGFEKKMTAVDGCILPTDAWVNTSGAFHCPNIRSEKQVSAWWCVYQAVIRIWCCDWYRYDELFHDIPDSSGCSFPGVMEQHLWLILSGQKAE